MICQLASIAAFALSVAAQASYGSNATSNATLQTYNNPILWEDLADLDVFRVNDTYYYSASNMAFSPGAPILKSYDLVNWEFIGHSVPTLIFNDPEAYNLEDGRQAYVRGIYASSLRYRPSNGRWYWVGCVDYNHTYIYSADDPTGEWSQTGSIETCYYDCGLLFDNDDTPYVAYGNTNISVAQLNADLTEQIQTVSVFNATFYIEGSRLYRINDTYYILNTEPASWEYTLKSSGGIFGPYTQQVLADQVNSTTPGAGHPHQGGIVETPSGGWYYMAFIDDYPEGRCPVLAPIYFDADGWPRLQSNDSFEVPNSYPSPQVNISTATLYGKDTFQGPKLMPEWEWNHNPNTSAYSFAAGGGLVLDTATVTEDIFHAKNTLTHRILGPDSTATIELDISNMQAGDRAGLALFRDNMAFIGVQDGLLCLQRNLSLGAGWQTISDGYEEASVALPPASYGSNSSSVWLRLYADVAPLSSKLGTFYYSFDGSTFEQLGTPYLMNTTYYFFVGYRFGIFNFATEELGGSVTVKSFDMVPGKAV